MSTTRMRRLASTTAALLLSSVTSLVRAQEQFTIQLSTSTMATAGAHNKPAVTQNGGEKAAASSKGDEDSQCVEYGRQSSGAAEAAFVARHVRKDSASAHATITADAVGGHFRTCLLGCGFRSCLGLHGNDTKARAGAAASAVFTISFDKDARSLPYELIVSNPGSLQNVSAGIEVRDETGTPLMRNATGGKVLLTGGSGKTFTVSSRLAANVDNEGGCCTTTAQADAVLGIRLLRAPLMESLGAFHPRIVGGIDALDGQFKEVGALLQDGRPHCTATLIGDDRVLTAAHCVFERDVKLLSFVLGNNAWQPQSTYPIASYRYPKGENGFKYDDKSLVDDVAVLRLQSKVNGAGMPVLHAGLPALSDIKYQEKALTFVGYGYRLVDNSPGDRGIKRFVDIPIDQLDGSTFRNKLPGVNTCKGDSGGPAMFVQTIDGHLRWVVAGITSGGDLACVQYGVNTRVDKYRDWILLPN